MIEFKQHQLEWTDEKVSRFWDFQNQYEPFEEIWFTKQVGPGIINFIKGHVDLKGTILDYGTGKGHLVQHLLKLKGSNVYGFDFSPESISNVGKKYKSFPNYKGTQLIRTGDNFTPYDSNFFDVVFLIEAIEHLTDKYLQSTLIEIHRILKKDGVIVITTPNDENLALQHVFCADCGAIYHRVQHMRKFSTSTLRQLMEDNSFTTKSCGVTNFMHFNKKYSPMSILKRALRIFRGNSTQPHLWYIGKK